MVFAGLDIMPFEGDFDSHHARCRREDGDGLPDGALALQILDLRVGEVPVGQAGAGGLQQLLAAGGGVELPQGDEVLLLGREQVGAVNVEQWLALLHGLAHIIHMQGLDPAVELGVDRVDTGLVEGDRAEGTDRLGKGPALHAAQANPHVLAGHRVDADGRTGSLLTIIVFRVHWHQVHAHGRFAWRVANVGGIHGRHPVFDGLAGLGVHPAGLEHIRRHGRRRPDGSTSVYQNRRHRSHP
ncbi:hypothetical protein DESC_740081 [Desulfosarcina cetonica]|nr:hypothetical protein DESC_740081 [Desulfosarcina cetonica]